jgi:hypothetical protein
MRPPTAAANLHHRVRGRDELRIARLDSRCSNLDDSLNVQQCDGRRMIETLIVPASSSVRAAWPSWIA